MVIYIDEIREELRALWAAETGGVPCVESTVWGIGDDFMHCHIAIALGVKADDGSVWQGVPLFTERYGLAEAMIAEYCGLTE